MTRLVGSAARAWMLCAVALLWAWEAAADDPPESTAEAVAAPADGESLIDLSALWDLPAGAIDRIRGGR